MGNKIMAVRYIPDNRELEVSFSSGARLVCPVEALEMMTWTGSAFVPAPRPSDEQLCNVRVWAGGYAIDFPDIQQNFDLDELMAFLPIERQTVTVGITSCLKKNRGATRPRAEERARGQ